tara:strand:+ start:4431 stop:4991 length:561 start_codon:yes stop_codon:yes gene_type:complete
MDTQNYYTLKKQNFQFGIYKLIPIRFEDRYKIMEWRNEQLYHLRQPKPLTKSEQDYYFKNVVIPQKTQKTPDQILFSFLKKDNLVAYGGLVHINWIDKDAEISFVIKTSIEKNNFISFWNIYLKLIEDVAFNFLKFKKIYIYSFDVRPLLYNITKQNNYKHESTLEQHVKVENIFVDVHIHSKLKQ